MPSLSALLRIASAIAKRFTTIYLDFTARQGLEEFFKVFTLAWQIRSGWFSIGVYIAQTSRKATWVQQMNGQSVERLMEIILQMRINLGHINETLHQQTCEIRQQLGLVFEDEKQALERCLNGIDEKLRECSASVEDYRRRRASLVTMREKLVQLGADPNVLPMALPEDNAEGIIAWRLRELKEQGKL